MNKAHRYSLFYVAIALIAAFMFVPEGAAQDRAAGILLKKDRAGISSAAEKAKVSVVDYFKPVSGTVAATGNRTVKVRFDSIEDVKEGMRFSVFRKGGTFYHPVTKEPVGNTEDLVGRVEAVEADPAGSYHICRVIKGEIRPGDIVRITSSRIKLAFFQDRMSVWGLSEDFYESLKGSGRFEILESYTASFEPGDLAAAAGELGAEAFLILSTPVKNGKRALHVKLYWTGDAALFGEIEEFTAPEEGEGLAVNEFMSSDTTGPGPRASFRISRAALIATGDVDGNGQTEVVVSDGRSIRIYNLKRDELHELWHIKGTGGERHLSLDILDLNNNGIQEIFVTSLARGGIISSFVIEYGPSGYGKIKEGMHYFLRVSGNKLLMQKFNFHKFVTGPVYEGEWSEGEYRTGVPLDLPGDANIYGFAYIDWRNDGRRSLMTYDDQGHLSLYDENGQPVWTGEKTYWVSDLTLKRGTYSPAGGDPEWRIRGRLQTIQTERGSEIIVVKKIPHVSVIPGFGSRGSRVYSLWWDGESMNEKLIIKEIQGSVTDYRLQGNSLFVIVPRGITTIVKEAVGGEFSRKSLLQYYRLVTK